MKDYTIVNSQFYDKFIEHVKAKLRDGWELSGSMATTIDYQYGTTIVTRYHQPMTKEITEPEPVLEEKRPVGRPKKVKQ